MERLIEKHKEAHHNNDSVTSTATESAEITKQISTKFAEWFNTNYCLVTSKSLKQQAWVNCIENNVLLHGSDWHYTELIKNHGKTIDEVFKLFIKQTEL